MSRDYKKLRVFQLADELVPKLYKLSDGYPTEEKFGLKSQVRRAAVSVPTNIVEGCYRPWAKEYRRFITVALSSAAETHYLLGLSRRLKMLDPEGTSALEESYHNLLVRLNNLVTTLGNQAGEGGEPPYSFEEEE